MRQLFLVTFLLFSTKLVAADYQQEIDKFFESYSAGKVEAAVDGVYSTNQYVSAVSDQVKAVKNQLASLSGLVGSIHHIRKVSDYRVSDLFVHVTYIVTFDRQPIRFEFQFFKAKDGWRMYSLSFDDDMDDEIKVLARQEALKANKS